MLACPICGRDTNVVKTTNDMAKESIVYRIRRCENGHETSTMEIPTHKNITKRGFFINNKMAM